MFDVIWTDPDRELVGEHRAKKEIAREQKRDKDTSDGSRSSFSTRGSSSSSDRAFGIFSSRGLRRAVAPLMSRPSSHSSTTLRSALTTQDLVPRDSVNEAADVSPGILSEAEAHPALSIKEHCQDGSKTKSSSRGMSSQRSSTAARVLNQLLTLEHIESVLLKWIDRPALSNLSPISTSFSESIESSISRVLGTSSLIPPRHEISTDYAKAKTDCQESLPEMPAEIPAHWTETPEAPSTPQPRISWFVVPPLACAQQDLR
jgi:hypothetical protein